MALKCHLIFGGEWRHNEGRYRYGDEAEAGWLANFTWAAAAR
jgi:hypothetical protein